MDSLQCAQCSKMFTAKRNLVQHLRVHAGIINKCMHCGSIFTRKTNLHKHIQKLHTRGGGMEVKEKVVVQSNSSQVNIETKRHREDDVGLTIQPKVPRIDGLSKCHAFLNKMTCKRVLFPKSYLYEDYFICNFH